MTSGSDPWPVLGAGNEGHGPSAPRVLGRRGQGQQQVRHPWLRMPQTFSLAAGLIARELRGLHLSRKLFLFIILFV